MDLIIASQNQNKITEIRSKLEGIELYGLSSKLFPYELREDGKTLEANAMQKARQVYEKTRKNCFADDTGLEIEALNGEPGVYSARYAGSQKNSEDNMDKVLANLSGSNNREAQFRTVIALIEDGKELLFEGVCKGRISEERMGTEGFGYDPIFIPEGEDRSFAQMTTEEKNAISHRGRAVEQLVNYLNAKR